MGKVILITGASRGIGRATAALAGRQGWSVGVNYARDEAAAAATVSAVEAAGGQALALRGDVADDADVERLFEETERAFGPVDGLVNNAGIVAPTTMLANASTERLRRMFDVNVLGAFFCARAAARRMSRSRGGRGGVIVNLSSAAARLGSPNEYVDYASSKGAIDTMTIGLAKELAPEGIRVNAVRPGLIDTEIHASGGRPDRAQTLGRTVPMGRPGTADEIAEAVIWLLGDASSYVAGALIDVSGGR
jgi:NAD(P)-dependent dehydrogenase (short-subunit alcohol dehydrogenase family)